MNSMITAPDSNKRTEIDFVKHAAEVNELQAAYEKKANKRIPVHFEIDEQFWMMHSSGSFKDFYTNPEVHLNAQLQGNYRFVNQVIGDMAPGIPAAWNVNTVHWMEENEFFGCEVVYQENDYAWARPLPFGKRDLLKHIADIDPEVQVRKNSAYKLYLALKELTEGRSFADRPINILMPGIGTQGIFTKAAEIRGLELLCMDMVDDPEWFEEYLSLITEKSIARSKAWYRLINNQELMPSEIGFLGCDDSIQMISADFYERLVLPCHEKYFSAFTKGWRGIHLCGKSMQHYRVLHDKLGISIIDGPGLFADHGYYLRELGPDFSIIAQFDHTILALGSEREIEEMVQKFMRPETKLPGRFMVKGYIHRLTKLENVSLCYRLAKEYGMIEPFSSNF